ncbi:hypothetical protein FHS96_004325 [Sphingomonas zeicaulis]|uniref:hypothetical protein n=1 Tax=Sphingomonas zeicaulis TaxID=1632740 RepID=UPI003D1DFA8E
MPPPPDIRALLDAIADAGREVQGAAFMRLCALTEVPPAWAPAVWSELLALLDHRNNRTRAIAGQLLARIAPAVAVATVVADVPRLVTATHDPQFVTGRHILQALARLGMAPAEVRARLAALLADRFVACAGEKNATLIRLDIQMVLRALHDRAEDEAEATRVRQAALDLVLHEPDPKYARRYLGCWK